MSSQLPLFDETVRQELERTQWRLAEALEDNTALRQRLEHAKVEYRKLRAECTAREAMAATQQRELTQAHWEVQFWKDKYGEELAASLHRPRATPTPEALLKTLLTLAHPDKWSQGQPATALAHELAVVINAVRAEVQG